MADTVNDNDKSTTSLGSRLRKINTKLKMIGAFADLANKNLDDGAGSAGPGSPDSVGPRSPTLSNNWTSGDNSDASDSSTDSGSSSDDGSADSESSGSDSDDGEPRARAVKPGNVDPRKLNRDALTGALKKLNLRTLAKKLRAEGIDDLETITHYSVEELRKVGFTAEQANRLHAHALLHEAEVQEQRLKAIGEIDIFLSHNWGLDDRDRDNHERVVAVDKLLKKKGYKTWCDTEDTTGDMVYRCKGIDHTKVILCFITKRYMEKVALPDHVPDNCKKEFMYAVRKHTAAKILPICMEPQMLDPASWEGPIGMELGSLQHHDFSDGADKGITGTSPCFELLCKGIDTQIVLGQHGLYQSSAQREVEHALARLHSSTSGLTIMDKK